MRKFRRDGKETEIGNVELVASKDASEIAQKLADLYKLRFGGRRVGRFRISRKYLRVLAGRNRLTDQLVLDIANEIFEHGYVFIDVDSFFVVLDQARFANYRRVTNRTLENLDTTTETM